MEVERIYGPPGFFTMMTEDDTFKILRRAPIRQMIRLWEISPITSWTDKNAPAFFEKHGWNREEFEQAWSNHNGGSYLS